MPTPARASRAPKNPTVTALRARLGPLVKANGDGRYDAEIVALRSEIATLGLVDRIRETLDAHHLDASQRHRLLAAMGGSQ